MTKQEQSGSSVLAPPRQANVQIWHVWPDGWPAKPGQQAACGYTSSGSPPKRANHELCVVCSELRSRP